MCNLARFRSLLSLVPVVCVVFAAGCGTQPSHPNQLSSFDGESYNSLTLAQAALTSLRTSVAVSYPKYIPMFNQAAASYAATYNAYVLYRTNPGDQAAVALAVANLTVSIVALENSFEADLPVSPKAAATVRGRARDLRARAIGQKVTVSDILTELEIAAAIAVAVPSAAPAAGLAAIIIAATNDALAAESAAAGQAIDLTAIQPVAAI